MYSQFNEEEILLKYFGDKKGFLIDIGANDGKTFSNSLKLIEMGWEAICVEPTKDAFERLKKLHEKNERVNCVNAAITEKDGKSVMIVNGSHYSDDVGLLSVVCGENFDIESPVPKDVYNWKGYEEVETKTFQTLIGSARIIDLICIDAEGYDFEILKQIDLPLYNTQMVIVETDNTEQLNKKFNDLLVENGFSYFDKTITNLIYTKK